MGSVRKTYTTEDEIDYINNISSRKDKNGDIIMHKLYKLMRYKKSLFRRFYWGDIDKTKTLEHLENLIDKEFEILPEIKLVTNNKKKGV
jgi:hypothetical protein